MVEILFIVLFFVNLWSISHVYFDENYPFDFVEVTIKIINLIFFSSNTLQTSEILLIAFKKIFLIVYAMFAFIRFSHIYKKNAAKNKSVMQSQLDIV